MRYNMRDRISRPYPEDSRLWRALDDLNVRYDKMAEMHQPTNDMRRSKQVVPAKVYMEGGAHGLIDYKEMWYIKDGKQNGFNSPMKNRILAFRELMRIQGIPQCIVSRVWTVDELKVVIKRWLNEQRKIS